MKKLICILLALLLLASLGAAAYADSGIGIEPGQRCRTLPYSLRTEAQPHSPNF